MNNLMREKPRARGNLLSRVCIVMLTLFVAHEAIALDPTTSPEHYVYTSWAGTEGLPQATVQAI